jgi:UDP-3-O-[3-hydroxymyristoyl] glucosamine N-acyltransferase
MTAIDLPTLAECVQGQLVSQRTDHVITGAAPLADAQPGHITLIDNEKHLAQLQESQASACITHQSFPELSIAQIVVSNPHDAFTQICKLFRPQSVLTRKAGIDPMASVSPTAKVSSRAFVEAFVSIAGDCEVGDGTHLHSGVKLMAGCRIGKDCQLFPGVVLYPGTVLEDRVVLHANCVIGSHGFGYKLENGCHVPTAQVGWVHIESDVEMGASCALDRGTYGATRIGAGTKFDNLVHLAHNCNIGKHNLICAQVGIAGSSSTGDYVVMAGQVGVRDHVHVGSRTIIGAQSGISADTGEDKVLWGTPAINKNDQALVYATLRRLPEIRKTVQQLTKQVAQLQTVEKPAA